MWQRYGTCAELADQAAYFALAVAAAKKFDTDVSATVGLCWVSLLPGGTLPARTPALACGNGGSTTEQAFSLSSSSARRKDAAPTHGAKQRPLDPCMQVLFRSINCTTGFDAATLKQKLKSALGNDVWLTCNAA